MFIKFNVLTIVIVVRSCRSLTFLGHQIIMLMVKVVIHIVMIQTWHTKTLTSKHQVNLDISQDIMARRGVINQNNVTMTQQITPHRPFGRSLVTIHLVTNHLVKSMAALHHVVQHGSVTMATTSNEPIINSKSYLINHHVLIVINCSMLLFV